MRTLNSENRWRETAQTHSLYDIPPKDLQPSNTFLASRLGVGYVNFDKWVECDPKDALLFLG
jgi:hypothetical protein